MNHTFSLTVLAGAIVVASAAPAFAQTPSGVSAGVSANGVTQFRDERTGKVWTPENVSKDNQTPTQQAAMPQTPADKAFDPNAQIVPNRVVVQRPRGNLMGTVPITAGPTVPTAQIDSPWLQAVPQQSWLSVVYLTNNSANVIDPVVACTFTNAGRPVQETQVILSPAGPGERWGFPVYGPPVTTFVDRVICRLLAPI
ncbi:MAG: hypothetical protein EPO67_23900 [Reyranella sp.]|nr:MAG: hypothetical protein EPO67_23900 [Reyranella sp.]